MLVEKLKEMLEEIENRVFDDLILTQVIDCYQKFEFSKQYYTEKNTRIVRGSLVDKILKYYFKDINQTYLKQVEYKGVIFYLKPDFIIDNVIYELKVYDRLYISDRVLKQCFGYHKFYELPIRLVIIVNSDIHVINPFEDEEEKKRIEELFEKDIELFANKQPNTNECYFCPFSKKCPYYQDPFGNLKLEYSVNAVYKLKHNIKDNSIIITPNGKKYRATEIKEEDE